MHRLSWPLLAITSSVGAFVIDLLVGYIIYATLKRIAKVEDDYQEMMELKKRAEAADITKSQALATVSHEIRTPMDVVLGHAGNDRSPWIYTISWSLSPCSGDIFYELIKSGNVIEVIYMLLMKLVCLTNIHVPFFKSYLRNFSDKAQAARKVEYIPDLQL